MVFDTCNLRVTINMLFLKTTLGTKRVQVNYKYNLFVNFVKSNAGKTLNLSLFVPMCATDEPYNYTI